MLMGSGGKPGVGYCSPITPHTAPVIPPKGRPMSDEAAFLNVIAADPDDDTPRPAYADWLDENGDPDRAEFIRLQIRLEPDRDRFDDDCINALRDHVQQLQRPLQHAEVEWLSALHAPMQWTQPRWRRGFVDALELPVQWLIRFGEDLRAAYPLLRKLVLFRVNGWGERLAECEALRGIRELELACWYGDRDAEALAASRHLGAVERLVYWSGESSEQPRLFARARAWPKLKNLHLMARHEDLQEWIRSVNETAGRPVATAYHIESELFPFAADIDFGYIVGKLPDGTQLFIPDYDFAETVEGATFGPDGTPREAPFHARFPPELGKVPDRDAGWDARWIAEKQIRQGRVAHLQTQLGFVPAFIRVKAFNIRDEGPWRLDGTVEENWGTPDDPTETPETPRDHELGYGWSVYYWVTTGSFVYDAGNHWVCDGSGHVTFT
jgi:uncharacterized protein (TIGR02996 family)